MAPSDSTATFSLCGGSPADSVLAVYRGNAVGNLTPVAGGKDDDGCGPSALGLSQVADLKVYEGRTYRIAVAGKSASGLNGSYTLTLSSTGSTSPANDDFADAEELTGASDTFSGTNFGATLETGEPNHSSAPFTSARSVWFDWTAPSDGQLTVSLCDTPTSADSVLGIYTGSSVDDLSLVTGGGDDDGCGPTSGPSLASVAAVAGTTYRIAVADFSLNTGGIDGQYELDLSFVSAGPTQECLDAQADLADAEDALATAKQRVKKAKAALKKAKKSGKASKIKKAKAKLKSAKKALGNAEADVAAAEAAVEANCN